jgi:aminoglycoside 6'-N-acetyltransferase
MELKGSGELVGDCGLCVKVAVPKTAEIGFSLAPEHQRKGLASEAVTAVVDHAVRELGVQRIIAVVMRDNDRSATLLSRLGLRHGSPERVWFKGQWNEELRFALPAEEWLARVER